MQFSLHRVWLLCRKQWAENQQLYLLGLLAMAGIMAAVIVFDLSDFDGFSYKAQQTIVYGGMTVAGAIFTTTILSQFNDKIKGIQALMLPVSTTDKIVVVFIYSMLVFPMIFLIIVYPLIAIGLYIDTHVIGRVNGLYNILTDNHLISFISTFVVFQSFALFCSVLFKRYVFVKMAVLATVIFFGLQIFNPIILNSMLKIEKGVPLNASVQEILYNDQREPINSISSKQTVYPDIIQAAPYTEVRVNYGGYSKYYKGGKYVNFDLTLQHKHNLIFLLLLYLAIPFLWMITWFKLKEKEL